MNKSHKFKGLEDLAVLKEALEAKEDIEKVVSNYNVRRGWLEDRLEEYAKTMELEGFGEVDIVELSKAVYNLNCDNFENIEQELENGNAKLAVKFFTGYSSDVRQVLKEKPIYEKESLGLFLIITGLSNKLSSTFDYLESGVRDEIKNIEEVIKSNQEEIESSEEERRIRYYSFFKNRVSEKGFGKKILDWSKEKGLFGSVERYEKLGKDKDELENLAKEKLDFFEKIYRKTINSTKYNVAFLLENILRKIDGTVHGPFNDINLNQALRAITLEVSDEVVRVTDGFRDSNNLHFCNLHRYSFLVSDNLERAEVLREALEIVEGDDDLERKYAVKYTSCLANLFGVICKAEDRADFRLLTRTYDAFKKSKDFCESSKLSEENYSLCMHSINHSFIEIAESLCLLEESGEEFKKLRENCKKEGLDFSRLYAAFCESALNSGKVEKEYEGSYRKALKFGSL